MVDLNKHLLTHNVDSANVPNQENPTHTCDLCDLIFKTNSSLREHVRSHSQINQLECDKCEAVFRSEGDMATHIQDKHPLSENVGIGDFFFSQIEGNTFGSPARHCNQCDRTFPNLNNLHNHIESEHTRCVPPDCDRCELTFDTHSSLDEHVAEVHAPVHLYGPTLSDHQSGQHDLDDENELDMNASYRPDISENDQDLFIPQLDGVVDIPSDSSTVSQYPSIQTRQTFYTQLASSSKAPHEHVRLAPYTLNKEKQIKGLGKNANAPDFTVDVTNETNASVHCSTGFYEAVVKPALLGLGEGYSDVVGGVPLRCVGVTIKRDQLGRNINHVLRFQSGAEAQTKNTTLHLHHSQQHVQVQGGATLWFLDHFLKNLFTNGARNKQFDIKSLNIVFSAAAAKYNRSGLTEGLAKFCSHCSKQFRTTSKPVLCVKCSRSFHNAKSNRCLIIHSCPGASTTTKNLAPGNQTSSQASSSSDVATSTSTISVQALPVSAYLTTNTEDPMCSSVNVPVQAPVSNLSPPITAIHGQVPTSMPETQLNPSVSNQTSTTTNSDSRKKRNDIHQTREKTEIEFLSIELNKAKTKILLLDSEKKELEQRISIQKSKLDILEKSQNGPPQQAPGTAQSLASSPSSTPCCYSAPRCNPCCGSSCLSPCRKALTCSNVSFSHCTTRPCDQISSILAKISQDLSTVLGQVLPAHSIPDHTELQNSPRREGSPTFFEGTNSASASQPLPPNKKSSQNLCSDESTFPSNLRDTSAASIEVVNDFDRDISHQMSPSSLEDLHLNMQSQTTQLLQLGPPQ